MQSSKTVTLNPQEALETLMSAPNLLVTSPYSIVLPAGTVSLANFRSSYILLDSLNSLRGYTKKPHTYDRVKINGTLTFGRRPAEIGYPIADLFASEHFDTRISKDEVFKRLGEVVFLDYFKVYQTVDEGPHDVVEIHRFYKRDEKDVGVTESVNVVEELVGAMEKFGKIGTETYELRCDLKFGVSCEGKEIGSMHVTGAMGRGVPAYEIEPFVTKIEAIPLKQ